MQKSKGASYLFINSTDSIAKGLKNISSTEALPVLKTLQKAGAQLISFMVLKSFAAQRTGNLPPSRLVNNPLEISPLWPYCLLDFYQIRHIFNRH
jgi:hypothetical protein